MNIFALLLQAAPAPAGGGSFLINLFPIILMIGVFYFLLIVPQRRRQKELQLLISNLKAGDRIVTTGGILATVTAVRDASLVVRSADKTMLEISRSAVASMQAEEEKK
ncbi:MAG TPA: preprotein translocase subunit YajC [Pyrinomonadaceae bacterium]|jgi:preprotein translocase subunit YajC|nr:preprotein translocase subunit YajC [Pyrinomonadaceae bacterium]